MKKDKIIAVSTASYLLFIILWTVSHAVVTYGGILQEGIYLLLFYFLFIAVSGIIVPMKITDVYGFDLNDPVSDDFTTGGVISFIVALTIGIFMSGTAEIIIKSPPRAVTVLKYAMLFIPMAFAISTQILFLIPRIIERTAGTGIRSYMASVLIPSVLLGVGFFAGSLFTEIKVALSFIFLGLFLTIGAVLTRSFYMTTIALSLLIFTKGLAEGKHFNTPWWMVITGFLVFSVTFARYFMNNLRYIAGNSEPGAKAGLT
ncbi:MAG: hypothetical protein ABIH89_05855 [Elusimicrobiota bacterium]